MAHIVAVQSNSVRRQPGWLPWLAASSLVINGLLAWFMNALLLQNVTSISPLSGFLMMIGPWALGLVAMVSLVTLVLRAVTDEDVQWREVASFYLVANLAHILSGLYSVIIMALEGVPGPDQSLIISLNLGGWSNSFGRFLSLISIDELLHLGIFVALVRRRYQLSSMSGLLALVFLPWIFGLIIWSMFLGQMGQ